VFLSSPFVLYFFVFLFPCQWMLDLVSAGGGIQCDCNLLKKHYLIILNGFPEGHIVIGSVT